MSKSIHDLFNLRYVNKFYSNNPLLINKDDKIVINIGTNDIGATEVEVTFLKFLSSSK